MRNNIFNWMKLSSFIFALSSLFASCSNELDDTLQPVENGTLQFVIGDFPAFGEGAQTRAIGTQDEGKTAWENGDNILVTLISQKYGEQANHRLQTARYRSPQAATYRPTRCCTMLLLPLQQPTIYTDISSS